MYRFKILFFSPPVTRAAGYRQTLKRYCLELYVLTIPLTWDIISIDNLVCLCYNGIQIRVEFEVF